MTSAGSNTRDEENAEVLRKKIQREERYMPNLGVHKMLLILLRIAALQSSSAQLVQSLTKPWFQKASRASTQVRITFRLQIAAASVPSYSHGMMARALGTVVPVRRESRTCSDATVVYCTVLEGADERMRTPCCMYR